MANDVNMIIQLIQVAIGYRKQLSLVLSEKEWWQLYEQSKLQAVAGVCLAGVGKLPKEQWPPKDLLKKWMGLSEVIKLQNTIKDDQTATMWRQLKEAGLDGAVLKGQGIACGYGELAPLRQSGDIDIWVLGGYQKVCDYVQRTHPTDSIIVKNNHVYADTKPYRFRGKGRSKDWIISGNTFDQPVLQSIPGKITVKNLVVSNNKKNSD